MPGHTLPKAVYWLFRHSASQYCVDTVSRAVLVQVPLCRCRQRSYNIGQDLRSWRLNKENMSWLVTHATGEYIATRVTRDARDSWPAWPIWPAVNPAVITTCWRCYNGAKMIAVEKMKKIWWRNPVLRELLNLGKFKWPIPPAIVAIFRLSNNLCPMLFGQYELHRCNKIVLKTFVVELLGTTPTGNFAEDCKCWETCLSIASFGLRKSNNSRQILTTLILKF